MKIGILASGNLGYIVSRHLVSNHEVEFIMTDKNSSEIYNLSQTESILVFQGNPRKGRASGFISDKKIDVLISVNYLFIIEIDLIELPKILAFNIHGSLLPKYRGRSPHVWSIINNESMTGITAHVIDEGCDTGDILEQVVIDIHSEDTGGTILEKYQEAYIPIIDKVLLKIQNGQLKRTPQDNRKATFFGSRTPEDGRINWDWQKERIRNWVRAQANPYPGAFSFYGDQKITIDKVVYSDFGYQYDQPNGLLLSTDPLLVKTSNGVLELEAIRETGIDFQTGSLLL
jgi:methionyl-tRNA formyltransferase